MVVHHRGHARQVRAFENLAVGAAVAETDRCGVARIGVVPLHGLVEEADCAFADRDRIAGAAHDELEAVEQIPVTGEAADRVPRDDDFVGDVGAHVHHAAQRIARVHVGEER